MAEETITIGANSQQAVDIPGRFFACLSSTSTFKIEIDHGGKRLCSSGVKFSFEPFKRIVFFETAGVDNTITFYAGDSQYDGVVPRVGDAVPVIASGGATTVGGITGAQNFGSSAAPTGVQAPGTVNGRKRKFIKISNSGKLTPGGAATNNVLVVFVGSLAGLAVIVQPGITETIETEADLLLAAMSGDLGSFPANLYCTVLEIFYNQSN